MCRNKRTFEENKKNINYIFYVYFRDTRTSSSWSSTLKRRTGSTSFSRRFEADSSSTIFSAGDFSSNNEIRPLFIDCFDLVFIFWFACLQFSQKSKGMPFDMLVLLYYPRAHCRKQSFRNDERITRYKMFLFWVSDPYSDYTDPDPAFFLNSRSGSKVLMIKLKQIYIWKFLLYFFDQKLQFT